MPYIPDQHYRILIIGGSRLGQTNVLLNLIKNQRPDNHKIYLDFNDPFKSKYQLLINGREKVGIKKSKNPKGSTDYSQTVDVYEKLEGYNPTKKKTVLIVFDGMIADIESNKKLSPTVHELFPRGKKVNISLIVVSQSYLKMPKIKRLNPIHYFIMKIPNNRELQINTINNKIKQNKAQ